MVHTRNAHGQYHHADVWNQARYNSMRNSLGRSPLTIREGLELCGITGDNYFVVVETEGKCKVFSSPATGHAEYGRFFNEAVYVDEVERQRQGTYQRRLDQPGLSHLRFSPTGDEIRTTQVKVEPDDISNADGSSIISRKRDAAGSPRMSSHPRIPRISVPPKRGIEIGDDKAVYAFYDERLRLCQQSACKTIAKAWVKALEPRKQSKYPYTRGLDSAPEWWPRTYVKSGTDVIQKMRHREPDHLSKDERVRLLTHILRLVVEPPATQHESVLRANMDLVKLEAVTFEALSVWFSDQNAPNNSKKKPILQEIFRVARQERRFKLGEIDPKTEVFVQDLADRRSASQEVEEESDNESTIFTPGSSVGTPNESAMPPMMGHQPQPADQASTYYTGNSIAEAMSARTGHYGDPAFHSDMVTEHAGYTDASPLATHVPVYGHSSVILPAVYPPSQGPSRRSSIFSATQEYESPAPSAVYPSWQSPASTSSPSLYGYAAQPTGAHNFGGHLTPSPHMPSPMEGLETHAAASQQNGVYGLRPTDQPGISPQPGYLNYAQDGAPIPGAGIKPDDNQHHHQLQ
ncbi:hypothetical protein F5Y17DRAFT_471974 [Xylariaceae sp. FL0594]|nr:hypothetical protein F5Y17DRAFT_471974 [Xylariaceae sp. FL0594]